MVKLPRAIILAMGVLFITAVAANAEQTGSIRGKVLDKDLDTPLAGVQVLVVERNLKATTMEQGNFVINEVPPGKYTLVFTKDGYARQSKGDVTVAAGEMTDVDLSLVGDVTEMDEFVCQDTKIGAGSETELLTLRADSAALISGIGSDQIKRAAASDAASALKLVSGASVQDDKYAVIRGLPDRYVSSQMNGVRLPTADVDKRAVQLDQFPAAIIERLEVTKTFTPDQQGDATGGAVNVVLKGIPEENMFKFDLGTGIDTQTAKSNNFLTSKGGSPNWLAWRDKPSAGKFSGPVGVSRDDSPMEYNWSMTAGGKKVLPSGWKIGGMASLFYKRNNYFDDDGVNNSLWALKPGAKLTPRYGQGSPEQGDFKTSLFDVTRGNEEVKWGGMGAAGIENKNNMVRVLYLYTRAANNITTLAQDTRGKQYYFPDYRVDDPLHPGNQARDAAPYLRTETLEYAERTTQTLQLSGKHTLPVSEIRAGNVIKFLQPTVDWTGALSDATMDQPDKRQFGSLWWAPSYNAGHQAFNPSVFRPYKPAANFTVGNLQRVWRDITEDSAQYFVNLKYPFEQWSGDKGYFKFGVFNDHVTRNYNQDSFSNFNDNGAEYKAPFENFWSRVWTREGHPMSASDIDVDYRGKQNISAWYYMADIPTCHYVNIIGGVRYETTKLSIVNKPEKDVSWYPNNGNIPWTLKPGDADVTYNQNDALPSIGLVVKPVKQIK
ncbi:MAG: TonB-dependent receptor, partial [Planctomycetaceae bacterium]